MGIKKLSPITPGQRHRIAPTYDEITKSKPEKGLVVFLKERGGRNNSGKMTMRYRGGGNKRMYRLIDFKRDKHGIPATVKAIEYDPYRSARIALLFYADGEKRYIIAPDKVEVGQMLYSGPSVAPDNGNCLPLRMIPLGTVVHNVELKVGKGGQLVRSAGTGAQLMARDDKYATLKMPSGEMRMVLVDCFATVGVVSNQEHLNTSKGKAGRNRWLGVRPRTRGVAMNPVDHPMGGGEGKSSGGHPRSRKGLYAKGKKTRTPNKYSDRMILSKKK